MENRRSPSNDAAQAAASQALQQGDVDAAVAIYEKAIQQNENDLALQADFGFLLWKTFEFDRGRSLFQSLVTDQRTDVPTLKAIAKRFFEIGQFGDATQVMGEAVSRAAPSDSETIELHASTLERDHQIERARAQAELALSLNPGSINAVRLLAHIDKRAGRYDRAVSRLQQHLRDYAGSDDWRLRYELAASLDRLGEFREAWNQLTLAKAQLRTQTEPHLRDSYVIRNRQWEVARRITDADFSRWKRECDQLQDSPERLVLLAGFPRSGTTLLEQLIANHQDCIGTDETGILLSQFSATLVWQAESPTDALVEIRSFDADQLCAGRSAYRRMTEAFLGEPVGGRLLIEKEPLLTSDLAMPLRLFPESSLLMPLRDPRDVVVSYFFTMIPMNWNSSPSTNILETCRFYGDCMRHWLLLRDRLPCPTHEVRYEDLAAEPADTLKRVCQFLELGWDDSMLDTRRRSERKAVRTPTYDDITKPISTRAVGRWVNYEEYLEPAMPILAPFLKAFGYDDA